MRSKRNPCHWLLTLSLQLAAWIALLAIVIMTLGPLTARPQTPLPADFDRVAAYALLGLSFGLVYPRRIYFLAAALIVTAGGLEWAQSLVPGRDGSFEDFLFKACGTIIGISIARAIQLIFDKYRDKARALVYRGL